MRTCPLLLVLALCLPAPATPAVARDDRAGILSFEASGAAGSLKDWFGGPEGTTFIDSTVVHGGRYAGRLERGPASARDFSSLAIEFPIDFAGDTLELRGWLKYEGVTGFAGLWQRQDAASGVVQFDNMGSRHLTGRSDWQELRLSLPLDRRARKVTVGALLVGQGRVWMDDLQLLVDGKPLASAPERVIEKTVFDTDHEFDSGSKISIDRLSRVQIANLHTLGRVWGFLKYHHPRVVTGKLHWDYELFRIMPRVLAAHDRDQANRAMSVWVDSLGETPPCATCAKSPDGRPLRPRLDWLSDRALLGGDLVTQLRQTYASRVTRDEQFYVSFVPGVGNPDFSTELPYPGKGVPDAGYRLLALYRLWNIAEYWFPYRDVTEEDWEGVLREFIPRVVAADSSDTYTLSMMALIARMHDGHANLWPSLNVRPPRGACRLPVTMRFVAGQLVVTGYSSSTLGPASGLRVGDVVRSLDGVPVDSLVARWRPLYAASNEAARLRDVAAFIDRGPCDPVQLSIERPEGASELTTRRVPADSLDLRAGATHDHPGETFRRLSDDLAYLRLSSVKAADASDYIRRAAGAKCLIIDIRNYPSEFVVFALGGHLVSQPTPFAVFTVGDASNPGAFSWTPSPTSIEPIAPHFEGAVAILVDEVSQSQAEYTAMAFRAAPGAIVAGSTTAGADGNVSPFPLPGGLRGLMSGIGVFYPDHRPTQRIGIVPDLEVRPTLAGIRTGHDEVLEAAIRRLLGREMSDAERGALSVTTPSPNPAH